jgi:glycine oxidase
MLELCLASYRLYRDWAAQLGEVGFRPCGSLHVAFTESEAQALLARRTAGLEERKHPGAKLALFDPDEALVDPRRLLRMLREACARAGVELRARAEVLQVERDRVGLRDGELRAGRVVLCAGSWSGALLPLPVFPVRGQMIKLDLAPPDCVVFGAGGYAVPRDGRTLVGATVERTGFDALPTEAGRDQLLAVGSRLGYRGTLLDHWAGLRPGTHDGLPLFGERDGVLVATGHYRNGVLLAPISAHIVSALVRGGPPPLDLAPFDPARASALPAAG